MGPIYDFFHQYAGGNQQLGLAIMAATILVVVSTMCAITMLFLENRRKRILRTSSRFQLNKPAKITAKDVAAFPAQIWLITLICVAFYSATIPFSAIGKVYFVKKYQADEWSASLQQSLFFMSTVVTSPFLGVIVDNTGYNLSWVLGSICLATASHVVFMFTFWNSFLPVLMLGISLSAMYASLWPMVSLIVPTHHLGTAFGL
jgi:Na+/melibiose symporter-like transporter